VNEIGETRQCAGHKIGLANQQHNTTHYNILQEEMQKA
jgi:hypothetical protein